jgi:predicted Zn-dependent protease
MKSLFRFAALIFGFVTLICASRPLTAAPEELQATHHWRHMPVRVYFTQDSVATQDRINAAAAGFAEWGAATGGVIWYSVVDHTDDADVVVHFIPSTSVAHDAGRVGETETQAYGRSLRHADIRLAVSNTDLPQLTEEAAHEWGHALGIEGHSADPNDLMYPTTIRVYDLETGKYRPTPMRTVSADDLRAIKSAYAPLFRAQEANR